MGSGPETVTVDLKEGYDVLSELRKQIGWERTVLRRLRQCLRVTAAEKKNPHLPLLLGLLLLVGGLSAGQKENRHRLICQTGRLSRGDPFSMAVILIFRE